MKTTSKLVSGLAMLAAASSASAYTGIAGTKHNLGSAGLNNHTSGTTEICIFCHTPHGGDQSVSAPIWNRQVNTGGYTRYSAMGTTTFDSAENPIGSVSIACLSCHDGTQAMDVMINTPGSDSSITLPTGSGTITSSNTGGWSQTNQMSNMKASDNGVLGGDLIFLGTDLRNDHPISMQFAGGGITAANATATGTSFYGDPDYASSAGTTLTPGTSGTNTALGGVGKVNTKTLASGKRVWWVDTGTSGQQRTDFTLFTRDGTTASVAASGTNAGNTGSANSVTASAAEQPYVECATCHDPHTTNATFLRLPGGNQGSQVCLTCHTK